MKKYKIEFYSKLLNKRIIKVVEDPKNYTDAIILEVIEEPRSIYHRQLRIVLEVNVWK